MERGHPLRGAGGEWHHHAQAELTLFLRGSGLRFIGDHIGGFRAPELVLLGPALPHYWHESGPTAGRAVQFGVEFEEAVWRLPESAPLRALWAAAGCGLRFSGLAVTRAASALFAAEARGGLARLTAILELLTRLAALPPSASHPIASSVGAAPSAPAVYRGIRAAIRMVFENHGRHLPLSEVLASSGMSRATFHRHFVRHTGRSFTRFLAEVRLNAAARRLVETDSTVAEIAFESGFNNFSHFHHWFRALYGCPPRRFRQRMRTGATGVSSGGRGRAAGPR